MEQTLLGFRSAYDQRIGAELENAWLHLLLALKLIQSSAVPPFPETPVT